MQPDLDGVFGTLKKLLASYSKRLRVKADTDGRYELEGTKSTVIAGRKRSSVYFAGIIIQKGYVGLYFMPIYSHPQLKDELPDDLRKLIKGKSCFHVKDLDSKRQRALATVINRGYAQYKSEGWV